MPPPPRYTAPTSDREPSSNVVAVVVNYDSGERLGHLLDVLRSEVTATVVVDNDSSDTSDRPAETRDDTELIRNDHNKGFAAAANQGAQAALRNHRSDWILFANPDVHPRPGLVHSLLAGADSSIAAIAPKQVDADGHPLAETGGYEPSLARFALWAVVPTRFHGRRGPWLAPPFPPADMDVDWISGAFLAIRTEIFERLHGFDERFFLYQEDVDMGRRLHAGGHRVVCRASLSVWHEVAQGDDARRARETAVFVESLGAQFTGWRAHLVGAALLAGFALRSVTGKRRHRARAAFRPSLRLMLTGTARHG